MRSAGDYVYGVRTLFYDFGKRAQDDLYPLARRKQPERQEHGLALDPILVFVKIGVDKRNVGYPVRDQPYLRSLYLIYCLKDVDGLLRHYNHVIRQAKQFIHRPLLASGRI